MSPGVFMEKGCNVDFAAAIKSVVNVPVSTVAGINEPDMMEQDLADGKADLILMGRGLICEPEMPNKLAAGRFDDCNRCLRCNECHNRLFAKNWFLCTLNPEVGFETRLPVPAPTTKKNVLVVGGGPGGMMAALTAAKRGHTVTLCEKNGELGGRHPLCGPCVLQAGHGLLAAPDGKAPGGFQCGCEAEHRGHF